MRAVPDDDPDALRLVEATGAELSLRYGGSGLGAAAAQSSWPPAVDDARTRCYGLDLR